MSIIKLRESRVKPMVFMVTAAFLLLVAAYFLPFDIAGKLCFPVSLLCLASLFLTPWEISLALLFSALGDLAGVCGCFLAQMGSFAIAHIFYIVFFVRRYIRKVEPDRKLTAKATGYMLLMGICVAALLLLVLVTIVPQAPQGVVRVGAGVYAGVICLMLFWALLQRSSLYALGALLFVVSDFALAWRMFVCDYSYADIVILGTYFAAQWLLFVRATSYKVPHPIHLLRF